MHLLYENNSKQFHVVQLGSGLALVFSIALRNGRNNNKYNLSRGFISAHHT